MHCWSKNWTMGYKSCQIPYINLFNRHKNQNKIFVLPFWNILTVLVSTFRCLENVWILPHSSGFSFHLIWGTIYESQCQIQPYFSVKIHLLTKRLPTDALKFRPNWMNWWDEKSKHERLSCLSLAKLAEKLFASAESYWMVSSAVSSLSSDHSLVASTAQQIRKWKQC